MLVLSRKRGETLYVGDDVKISVLDVQGKRVRIGIEAPGHCRVIRGELRGKPAPADAAASGKEGYLPFLTPETVATECASRPVGDIRDAVYSFSLEEVAGQPSAGRCRPLKSK